MILITKLDIILGVAKRWRSQYNDAGLDTLDYQRPHQTKRDILNQLEALDLTSATQEEVNKIIGNDSWTALKCDECGEDVDAVVRVGEEPNYESQTACVCRACLAKAAQLLPPTP